MYKVIGNAVPPKLAEAIAKEILCQFGEFLTHPSLENHSRCFR